MQHQPGSGPPGMPPPPGSEPLPSLLTMKVDPPDVSLAELKLPQALEQALAFKSERAKEIGVVNEDNEELQKPEEPVVITQDDDDDLLEEPPAPIIRTKEAQNKQKRRKKRKKKSKRIVLTEKTEDNDAPKPDNPELNVEIEYIQEQLGINELDPMYRQFAKIFETFRIAEPESKVDNKEGETKAAAAEGQAPKKTITELGEDIDDDDDERKPDDGKPKMSKRKLKKLTRLSVAELKQLVNRPDVVEMHDVTARDPKLLVQLKAHRNTVPVPRHWCFKRKYLQGKRGIEKPPFDLPDFIKKTGIMEMRAALAEKEDQKTLKSKMRERARPKLGKIDIDYQKLHDAFFKWQTKPKMTIHGDLYYEGKEFETKLKEKKPGDLSDDLRTALGMPVGTAAHKVPPPWLIAMQRYGPPPSYPNLKIPGLNAPIPEACSFGYHAGGWGKPPVDELGKPLYGDVFGTFGNPSETEVEDEDIDKTMWGELESESEESEEEEEEEEEEDLGDKDESGLMTPAEGLVTPSGMSSVPAGLETPDIIELRKKKIESEMEGTDTPALYQVLPEKRVDRLGGSMMASTHVYDVAGAGAGAAPRRAPGPATVELALDPSELDLDSDAMTARYEQQIKQQQSDLQKEDLSDMVAEHVTRQKSKRKRQQVQENKPVKKYKEFKF